MSNTPALLRLDSPLSSLVISSADNQPVLAWFGDRLHLDVSEAMINSLDDCAHAFASLDQRAPFPLFPQLSSGFMGSAALSGRRANAASANRFSYKHAEQSNQSIIVVLEDKVSELELSLTLTLCESTHVASMTSELKNTGSTPYSIDWLASTTIPLPTHYTHCLSHHGRWGFENQSQPRTIERGRIDITNQHGRTGHEHTPHLICSDAYLNEDGGDAMFLHMGWSGNYSLRVERLHDGVAYAQAGVLFGPGEKTLAQGESYTTPTTYFTRANGLNACTQRFHQYARQHVLPKWTRTPRPVHANSWEAMYFDLSDEQLFSLVDAAAEIGAERFVLDDGWFINRRGDTAGLGDWQVDETIFPNGLTPLVNHVRSRNLQFGLWFEPEMVNPDSHLYREHPDWVLHFDGIETPLARTQLVLDVAKPEVSTYLFNSMSRLIEQYGIEYIKWDMNRDLVLAGDGQHHRASLQPPAVYELMRKLNTEYPALEIESCASGGARGDFGVLAQTGRVWTSDNIDPIARATIQQGFARFFPPEVMGAHVGHERAHLTHRDTNIHTRAIVALQGQFGFELDARKLDEEEKITLSHYTAIYKDNRAWFAEASYWQLPSPHTPLLASGLVSQSQDKAMFNVVLLDSLNTTRPGHVRLRGLDAEATYTVSLSSNNVEQFISFNRNMPHWMHNPFHCTGELLMNIGIPLPVMPPQSALLIACNKQALAS